MVQVVLGERHGAGTKVGARCIWDADTDTQASDQFLNVNSLNIFILYWKILKYTFSQQRYYS